ncbi:MAG TPA: hypothetical protein VLU46_05540 [Thermoanaerobaculia bacterium]|nr:hypothetical protein [Thermoanaerobaculia bacterium]
MRKALFWIGSAVLIALPIVFTIQIMMIQDLPKVEVWKWAVLGAALLLVYFSRSRDDVLNHHIA